MRGLAHSNGSIYHLKLSHQAVKPLTAVLLHDTCQGPGTVLVSGETSTRGVSGKTERGMKTGKGCRVASLGSQGIQERSTDPR